MGQPQNIRYFGLRRAQSSRDNLGILRRYIEDPWCEEIEQSVNSNADNIVV